MIYLLLNTIFIPIWWFIIWYSRRHIQREEFGHGIHHLLKDICCHWLHIHSLHISLWYQLFRETWILHKNVPFIIHKGILFLRIPITTRIPLDGIWHNTDNIIFLPIFHVCWLSDLVLKYNNNPLSRRWILNLVSLLYMEWCSTVGIYTLCFVCSFNWSLASWINNRGIIWWSMDEILKQFSLHIYTSSTIYDHRTPSQNTRW